MFLCESHCHTCISPDSEATLPEMGEAALAAGLSRLYVTDHCDLLDYDGIPVDSFNWPGALEQYRSAKAALAGRLDLRLGLELGSALYDPNTARRILAGGGDDLDFVLGSAHNWMGVHGNRDMYFSGFSDFDLAQEAVAHYLGLARELVYTLPDCYDSLAHIVYPLRYIRRDGYDLTLDGWRDQVRDIFTRIAQTDHALEFNTWHGRDMEIWLPLLKDFRDCGGRFVTLGSDAHKPSDMAKGIPEALELIRAAGFDCVTTFVHRQPVEHRIKD